MSDAAGRGAGPGDGEGDGVVVTTPTDTQIVLTRRFDAPARLVFAALTTPDLLKRWLGADGWHLVDAQVDLRVGGAWRFVSRGPRGDRMGHGGVYRVVDPPRRLVYTEAFDDSWYPGAALVDAVLAEEGEATTLTTTITFASQEVRDQVGRTPMARGFGDGYRRLDAVLAEASEASEPIETIETDSPGGDT